MGLVVPSFWVEGLCSISINRELRRRNSSSISFIIAFSVPLTFCLRRQFDLALKEAVDESAEWRYRFDEERQRANKCVKEVFEIKDALEKNASDISTIHERFQMLQKENKDLLKRL